MNIQIQSLRYIFFAVAVALVLPSVAKADAQGVVWATPNPVPVDPTDPQLVTTHISWESSGTPWVQIWVTSNGNTQIMKASSDAVGSTTASWIWRGRTYVFDLYAATSTYAADRGVLLDSVTVNTIDDFCPNDLEKLKPGVCGCGTADTDTDLDGVPDCNDLDLAPIYTPALESASMSAAHREAKVPLSVFGHSPDGRLLFSPTPSPAKNYDVTVFKPEALSPNDPNAPQIESGAAYSNTVTMATSDTESSRLGMSVYNDPAYSRIPYPSDENGNPAGNGAYETYRLIFIGKSAVDLDPDPDKDDWWYFLTYNKGFVTVSAPRTAAAAIHKAEIGVDGNNALINGNGLDQQLLASSEPLWGYEPTVSNDGRLLIWHGPPYPGKNTNGLCLYSYNSNPSDIDGWSTPRGIADMYYVNGPGASAETVVNGMQLFSDAYPIAKQPMRDANGVVFNQGEWLPCTYPWMSPDATELFFSTERNFAGATRSGVTAVGVRTNWALRHLDGAINPARTNLSSDDKVHFATAPALVGGIPVDSNLNPLSSPAAYEGYLLDKLYHTYLNLADGSPAGLHSYKRVMTNAFALSSTMWNPFLGTEMAHLWPRRQQDHVYGFFLSSGKRYVEVGLSEAADGHYLFSLPMNEMLDYDRNLMSAEVDGSDLENPGTVYPPMVERWQMRADKVTYNAGETPDTSGYFNTGTLLGGAQFPFEYHDTKQAWKDYWDNYVATWDGNNPFWPWSTLNTPDAQILSGEQPRGAIGNAVYFRDASSVRVTLSTETFSRFSTATALTAELWFMRLNGTADISLMEDSGLFDIRINSAGRLSGSVTTTSGKTEISGGDVLSENSWHHASLVREGADVRLYLNGVLVAETSTTGTFSVSAGHELIIVGPNVTGGAQTGPATLLIDEVTLSDVARTQEEIKRSAMIRSDIRVGGEATVPLGLELARQQVPTNAIGEQSVADLGKLLFFDPILSRGNTMSCATCHDPSYRFTLDTPVAIGNKGQTLTRNIPTLINRLFAADQLLDGASPSLEHQFFLPLKNPDELNFTPEELVERLSGDTNYAALFATAFGTTPAPVSATNISRSISAYLRTLSSGDSRFDRNQLTVNETLGLGLFFGKARCAMCHNGPNFTDERFHNIGRLTTDPGRQAVTNRAMDGKRFRTPTLRDIALTAPYFADGSASTLREVIDFYDRGGDDSNNLDVSMRPLGLTETEKQNLEEFLVTLTGKSVDTSSSGPAGQTSVVPELVVVGQGGCNPVCFFTIGTDFGTDSKLQMLDPLGEQVVLEYTASGTPNYNLGLGVPIGFYAGYWDNMNLGLTDPDVLSIYNSRGLWFQIERNGLVSNRKFLRP